MGIDTGAREIVGVGACSLRDTFFGHPASVYPGPSEILAHRAQAGGDVRDPPRHAKPSPGNTPAKMPRPKQQAATSGR